MRNLASALLLAHGVPMMQMGDEYGHSKVGSSTRTLLSTYGFGPAGAQQVGAHLDRHLH